MLSQNESFPPPRTPQAYKHMIQNSSLIPSGDTQPLGHLWLPAELKIPSAGKNM